MKTRIYSAIFFVIAISFVNACADLGEITLVKDGKANTIIVIAEEPTIATNLAAVELQYHIEKITSASLPIGCAGLLRLSSYSEWAMIK